MPEPSPADLAIRPAPRVVARHRCPAPGCSILCSPGHVGCRDHWKRVPKPDRARLIPRFQTRVQDPAGFHAAVEEARALIAAHA